MATDPLDRRDRIHAAKQKRIASDSAIASTRAVERQNLSVERKVRRTLEK
jgi:hypothetical protein